MAAAQGGGPQGPPSGHGPGFGPGGGKGRIKAELGLTDEQESQLRKLHGEQRKAHIRRRADLQIARMDLRELLAAKAVDDKAVAAKMKEINDLTAAGLKAHVDQRLAMRKVLTPEQIEKMQQHHNRPRPQFRGRRGPRRSEGPPPMGDEGTPDDDVDETPLTAGEGQ